MARYRLRFLTRGVREGLPTGELLRSDVDRLLDALPALTLSGELNLSFGTNFNNPSDQAALACIYTLRVYFAALFNDFQGAA